MFNKVILLGNLTRDIELRYASSGSAIGNSAIAVTRKFSVGSEKREETCFIDITFFGRTAEIANQYLGKGRQVLIEGRLQLQQWQDKASGTNRSKHVVVVESMQMLGGGNSQNSGYQNSGYQSDYSSNYTSQPTKAPKTSKKDNMQRYDDSEKIDEIDVDDFNGDEIPF
ncbi:single-stranded DNA-binding protein [uncultured Campylobacter sp.]|uniref:single-stranded DNA-binding protein n=1 Tax=uncultured Campylobacter sp. TaxID=218934 RepID=UPI0026027C91|nr:single-stranded DNA-binding protein [uncultured Campylobacter sp.]